MNQSERVSSIEKVMDLARNGLFEEAEKQCRRFLEVAPRSSEALHLLGVLRSIAGLVVEAEELIRQAIAIDGTVPKYFNNLGNACKAQGKLPESILAYRQAIELDANFVDALYNLGVALTEKGELDAALEHYARVIRLAPAYFEARNNAGLVLMRLGRYEAAVAEFHHAKELNPSVPGVWHNLGLALNANGDDEALEAFCQAAALQDGYAAPMLEAADILSRNNEAAKACEYYERVLVLEDGNLRALEGLAWTYEAANRLDRLRPLLDRGRALYPESMLLSLVEAKRLRREGKAKEALEILSGQDLTKGRDDVVAAVWHEKGMLHDRLGEPEQAFACFGEAKRIQAAMADKLGADKTRYLKKVAQLRDGFENIDMPQWPPLELPPLPNLLAFIVGFPRSGTTLLDQVLDSHPRAVTVEEKPLLATLMSEWGVDSENLMARLEKLTPERAAELRCRYLELAGQYVDLAPGQLLVDKFPLNIILVPLIHRLFPEARIILAIRHPCDVCLSCYMHLFGVNHAMANFFSLEDAMHLYGMVMDLWRVYAERLPLRTHRIRYEDVVSDFQGEIAGLLDFLGLEWDDRVSVFYEHAKAKGKINTPSYHQVIEPIYQRAAFRWKRYSKFFAPHMGDLAPYLALFDYEAH